MGSLGHVAMAAQKLKLTSISLGFTGFLAAQHLEFGLGRAGKALSSIINLVLAWNVWMRNLLSSAEVGETCSSSCSRI